MTQNQLENLNQSQTSKVTFKATMNQIKMTSKQNSKIKQTSNIISSLILIEEISFMDAINQQQNK
jgi:hypothetical protein